MTTPIIIDARNPQGVRQQMRQHASKVSDNLLQVPLVATILAPKETAMFDELFDEHDPLEQLNEAAHWLMAALPALDALAEELFTHRVPQQLLTVNSTVVLTFYLTGDTVNLMVAYSGRDGVRGAFTADCLAFSWALEHVAGLMEYTVGCYGITLPQAYMHSEVREESLDPYASLGLTRKELDNVNLHEDLGTLLTSGSVSGFQNYTVKKVLSPLLSARAALLDTQNTERFNEARAHAKACRADDYRRMALNHIDRMEKRSA